MKKPKPKKVKITMTWWLTQTGANNLRACARGWGFKTVGAYVRHVCETHIGKVDNGE